MNDCYLPLDCFFDLHYNTKEPPVNPLLPFFKMYSKGKLVHFQNSKTNAVLCRSNNQRISDY